MPVRKKDLFVHLPAQLGATKASRLAGYLQDGGPKVASCSNCDRPASHVCSSATGIGGNGPQRAVGVACQGPNIKPRTMRILRARMLHQLGTTVVRFFGCVSNYRDTHRIAILIGKMLTNQWMVGEWDHPYMCNSIGWREHVSIFGTINHMEKHFFCVSENRAPRNRLDYHH